MTHSRRHFGFLTLGMFGILVLGYILLASVVWFSQEINGQLQKTEASVVVQAPVPVISPTDYAQTILNRPENVRNTALETSPALRFAKGEKMFLMGF